MSIYKKLCSIQVELTVNKNQYNNFGKYAYRTLEDIQQGLKPLLKKHGCCVVLSDDIIQVGERHYNQSIATLIDIESGETVESKSMAREPINRKGMDESQITVATSSYSRKSAMNELFAIDDNRDPDVTTKDEAPNVKSETLSNYLKEHQVKAKDFASHFMINASSGKELLLNKPQLEQMVKEYKEFLTKQNAN